LINATREDEVSYGSNGTAAGGAVQLAQLENGFVIGSTNIRIV